MRDYVKKAELSPFKLLFNEAMVYVHKEISDLKYYHRLVGSAKRNLVIEHHNKGFDLDYQIIFYKSINPKSSKELIDIKKRFRNAFNNFFVNKGYEHGEDSTSAITIKNIDNSKIINSYDIVLISPEGDGLQIFKYQNDDKTLMNLTQIKNSLIFQHNYNTLKGTKQWMVLREKYKHKKINNNEFKNSFSLLIEALQETLDIK